MMVLLLYKVIPYLASAQKRNKNLKWNMIGKWWKEINVSPTKDYWTTAQCWNHRSRTPRSIGSFEEKNQTTSSGRLGKDENVPRKRTCWYGPQYVQTYHSNWYLTSIFPPSTTVQVSKPCFQHPSTRWSWCYRPNLCKRSCYGWWRNKCSCICWSRVED